MINHIKTLLLNMSLSELTADGREAPWMVDPRFNDIEVGPGLSKIRDALFPEEYSQDDKENSVRAAMVLIDRPELSGFLSFFDPREIPEDGMESVKDLYSRIPKGISGLEPRLVSSFSSATSLFRPSNDKSVDSALSLLKRISYESDELTLRAGAILIAYAIQLEVIRTRPENA